MGKILDKIEEFFWNFYFLSPERIIARKIWQIQKAQNICDIGCGEGELLRRIEKIIGYKMQSLGLDIFFPVLMNLKKSNRYTYLVAADIRSLPFKKNSFDIVLASQVVEHIEKSGILNKLVNVCRKMLIIYTPRGHTKFSPHEDGEVNIYQRHQSGYDIADFKKAGFRVHGIGSRFICNEIYKSGKLPVFIRPFFSAASLLATIFTYFFPRLADHLLCIKVMQ